MAEEFKATDLGMNSNITPRMTWSLVGFALSLLVPSTGQVQKYLGTTGVAVYILLAFSALLIGYRYILPRFVSTVTEKQASWLAVMTFLGLMIAFAIVYPIANSGIFGGGSDRDDMLNIATTELLHGRYPYYLRTYLGNPISILPGSILLAVPFVLLGNSAYQNFLWLLAFFIAVRLYLNDGRLALLLLWAILILSPVVLQELVTGGDLLSNSLFVLLFTLFTANSIPKPNLSYWKKLTSAILFGVALSSRANFILILPLVFSMLVQNAGWKPATKYIALTCVAFGAITIPFYLFEPQGFTPLYEENKFVRFESILPLAGIIVPITSGIIALALSFQHMDDRCVVLLRNVATLQSFPVLSAVVLSSLQAKKLDFTFAGYGLIFLFFGALASWATLVGKYGRRTQAARGEA